MNSQESHFYKNSIIYYATNLENWAKKENKTYFIKYQGITLKLNDIIQKYELKDIPENKIYKFLADAFNNRILKEVGDN